MGIMGVEMEWNVGIWNELNYREYQLQNTRYTKVKYGAMVVMYLDGGR